MAVAVAALLLPGAARAGTVTLHNHDGSFEGPHGSVMTVRYAEIVYEAAPGERNDVTATATRRSLSVADAGAPVTAGEGCRQDGPNEASCAIASFNEYGSQIEVRAGDGDDSVTLVKPPDDILDEIFAHGGDGADRLDTTQAGGRLYGDAGDDVLVGGDPEDDLDGGAGDDTVSGGRGQDRLLGGAGSDALAGGPGGDRLTGDGYQDPPARDVMDGGSGSDQVEYGNRRQPVDVDLERTDGNGAPGENDTLAGFERLEGGAASDRLAGDGGPNVIEGQGLDQDVGLTRKQHDTVIGRGGDDRVIGSDGPDRLEGGDGDDLLFGAGGADSYSDGAGDDRLDLSFGSEPVGALGCGPGEDVVEGLSRHDVLRPSCEAAELKVVAVSTRLVRLDASTLKVAVALGRDETETCRIGVRLLGPDHPGARELAVLGRGLARPRPGHVSHARVALTPRGTRVLSAGHAVPVRIQIQDFERCGGRHPRPDHSFGAFTLALPSPPG
jgi:hypothetical protein